jgi:hypothetical protein
MCGFTPDSACSSAVVLDLACTTSDRTTTIAVITYLVTISVKGNIDPNLVKWVQKTYTYNNEYLVVEQGENGQKHMHMLLQFEQLDTW